MIHETYSDVGGRFRYPAFCAAVSVFPFVAESPEEPSAPAEESVVLDESLVFVSAFLGEPEDLLSVT
jgi:hypothetical protein